jgi:hypothetical protein
MAAIPFCKQLDCGCETREQRLVSVCALHGNYTRQHVEKARAPRDGVDKDLQRQLVVALTPIVVAKVDLGSWKMETVAETIHDQVHEIMRRMD